MKTVLAMIVLFVSVGCHPIVIQSVPPASPAPKPMPPEPEAATAASERDAPPASEPTLATTSVALSEEPAPTEAPAKPEATAEGRTTKKAKDKGKKPGRGKPDTKTDATPDEAADSAVNTPAADSPAAAPTETPPSDQRIVERIEVRVDGSDVGVASRIDRVDPHDQHAYFAETADSGVVEPGMPCKLGERFDVKPKMPNYLGVELQPCAAKVVFNVPIAQAVYLLSEMGDEAMKDSNPALAQSYYATAARLLRKDDPKAADLALRKANEAAAQALGSSSKGKKLSRNAIDALREYQRRSQLPVTGELDDLTRHRISGVDVPEVMKRANAALQEKAPDDQKKEATDEKAKRTRFEPAAARRSEPASSEAQKAPEPAAPDRPRREPVPGIRPRALP